MLSFHLTYINNFNICPGKLKLRKLGAHLLIHRGISKSRQLEFNTRLNELELRERRRNIDINLVP